MDHQTCEAVHAFVSFVYELLVRNSGGYKYYEIMQGQINTYCL